MSNLIKILFASCLVCFVSFVGYSQSSTATLSGTVEDENRAAIPGARVTITRAATGLESTVVTNDSGSFTIPLLPPGEYTVMVVRDGFARVQLTNIVLNVGDQKSVKVELKVGDMNVGVEVRPDETPVSTSPGVSNTIDRNFVQNLSVNGRSFQTLILLTPGVTISQSSNTSPGQFSVNGQRTNANYFTVDGVGANTGIFTGGNGSATSDSMSFSGGTPGTNAFGGTNGLVSADSLEEFKIQTSTYSAEYGRQPGGQISLVTRSGKNNFQMSAFEYFRNEKLDANDWFVNAGGRDRSPLRQNIFGGTFGGPILVPAFGEGGPSIYNGRDRSFFFFSYEGTRLLLPQSRIVAVPSLRIRAAVMPELRKILDAFPIPTGPEALTSTACTQPMPPAQLNPRCSATQPGASGFLYSGNAPLTGVWSDPSVANNTSVRIDHAINKSISIFGRYAHSDSSTEARSPNFSLSQIDLTSIRSRSLTLGTTWIAGSSLTNDVRFNYTSDKVLRDTRLDDFGGAVPISIGDIVSDAASKGKKLLAQPNFGIIGAGVLAVRSGGATDTIQNQINLVDTVSFVQGSHSFRFGLDYRRLSPRSDAVDYILSIGFSNEDSIRNGTVGNGNVSSTKSASPIYNNLSIYGQDTWKFSPRLTFDLGLRWELNPPPGGDGSKIPTILGTDNIATATIAPAGTPMYKTQYTAFAPRLGIAYQHLERKGWEGVIRGGFGVYYDIGSGSAGLGLRGFPFQASTNCPGNPLCPSTLTFPYTGPHTAVPVFPTTPTPTTQFWAFSQDFKLPYSMQWNFSLEQSLGQAQSISVAYVSSVGRGLLSTLALNITPTAGGTRQNLNFGAVALTSNRATSDYHSMQVQFRRRLSNGLQALANYTWSHAIDEISSEIQENTLERGNANFDVRHNFSMALTYDLPFNKLKGFGGALLNGWTLDSIVHAQSATPLNLTVGFFNSPDGIQYSTRPDLVPGQPFFIDDVSVAGGRRLNPAAFRDYRATPGTGPFLRQGTLGRNVVRGFPLSQVDLGLRRQFKLTEKVFLQLKAEAFNVLNKPNFAGVGVSLASLSTFGRADRMLARGIGGLNAQYQIGGPRSIQLSVRLGF